MMQENTNNEPETQTTATNGGRKRFTLIAAGLSLGAGIVYLVSRVLRGRSAGESRRGLPEKIVDDRGTTQQKAAKILRNLRDRAFEASDEKLALALGRPLEEVSAWNAGSEIIDDDVVMKARGIAMHRGVLVE